MTKNAIRKKSQRETTLEGVECLRCGSTENLERHHPNYENSAFIPLCTKCHHAVHQELGTYPTRKKKICVICGTEFIPTKSTQGIVCSKPCLSIRGKQNAEKRWGKKTELTD